MITFEKARQHVEYKRIPEHVLADLYAYVEHHQYTGHFLAAVLSHDLFEAVARSDKESGAALRELVVFIHMEVRSDCHGNPAAVRNWLRTRPETSNAA